MKHRRTARAVAVLLVVLASVVPTHALNVRFLARRPGCETPDAYVAIANTNPNVWYKVYVNGTIGNGGGPTTCMVPDPENPGGPSIPSTACVASFTGSSGTQTLPPCHQTGFCKTWSINLPTCQTCIGANWNCKARSCDNRSSANALCPDCGITCNTASETCTDLTSLQVTILATSPNGRDWTTVNQTTDYGTPPSVAQDSYCTNHAPVSPAACVFPDLEALCVSEEE